MIDLFHCISQWYNLLARIYHPRLSHLSRKICNNYPLLQSLIKSKRDYQNSSFEIRPFGAAIPAELSREERFPVILWVVKIRGTGRFRSCSRTIYFHGRMTHCAGLSLFGKILAIRSRSFSLLPHLLPTGRDGPVEKRAAGTTKVR